MARNAIEIDFRSSKMAGDGHFVQKNPKTQMGADGYFVKQISKKN